MTVYTMHCGACGTELEVPGELLQTGQSESVTCPGCGQDRQVTT
ncbi:hypothetical protein [Microbispora sp. H10949]|nr:hypothetical protein [Microbispora sp. H10949]